MKLISDFSSFADAEMASHAIEAKGIATYVSPEQPGIIPGLRASSSSVRLWVVLDEQLSDAQKLLVNPEHEVTRKLSQKEIQEIKASMNNSDMSGTLNFLFGALGTAIVIAILVYVLTGF